MYSHFFEAVPEWKRDPSSENPPNLYRAFRTGIASTEARLDGFDPCIRSLLPPQGEVHMLPQYRQKLATYGGKPPHKIIHKCLNFMRDDHFFRRHVSREYPLVIASIADGQKYFRWEIGRAH